MNLSKPFILRPVLTSLLMIILVFFGILSFKLLPVSSLPQIEFPTIMVTTSYPGSSPEQMANLISAPLERQFMLMQGIEFVVSNNTYQSSSIVLQFYDTVDINTAAEEVGQAIQAALSFMPSDLPQQPTYTKYNPADTPIIYVIMRSPTQNEADLYKYGFSYLGQQLGTVNGIADIQAFGFEYAVRVQVDPQALAARNVTLQEIANAVSNANPYVPTGKFYNPQQSMVTTVEGQIFSAEGFKDVVIKYVDGNPLRLQDVAKLLDTTQNCHNHFYWFRDGTSEPATGLAIYRQLGYNTVQACDGIMAKLNQLKEQIPGSIDLFVPFSLADWIREAVREVELTLVVAFLLVVVVVFIYLGRIRNSLIPIITLPITVLGTFIFTYLFGFSLDIMSLSALTLSIGFLIDDAIVVLENIVRWAEAEKLSPLQAALKGAKQIIVTVISISLCLAAVFLPMLFLGSSTGQLFHEFAAVIIVAVLFSGFISLSLTPMLASRFLPPYDEARTKSRIERFSDWLNTTLANGYVRLLKKTLRFKPVVIIAAIASLAVSVWLIKVMPKEFLPPNDLGLVQAVIIAPEGTSPEKILDYTSHVVDSIRKNPFVEQIGYANSNPVDNETLVFYFLKSGKRPDIWQVMREVGATLKEEVVGVEVLQKAYPLINLQIGSTQSGLANEQYLLQSFDVKALFAQAPAFIEKLKASDKLANVGSDFLPNSPSYKMKIMRDQAYSYNMITATGIENNLQYALGETYISNMICPENLYYVILDMDNPYITDPQKLGYLYLTNSQKNEPPVSINSVTKGEWKTTPEMVNHVNALPSVTVSFDAAPNVPLSEAISEINSIAESMLSPSIIHKVVGQTAAFEQAIRQFLGLLLVAIFVIYVILGILYENFLHPLTPISSVPFATFGGLISLLVFHQTLSIYALIGIIMLLGIVMKNGILVVDFALEQLQEKQCSIEEAVIEACRIRFRPIIMTTIAAMMGAVPIALGIGGTIAKGRAPLGIAVVGGLIIAQLVTLFVIPAVFVYIQRLSQHLTSSYKVFKPYLDN
ncbi:MAG: hypothetical protein A3F09_03265 [Chlamydiae bacterium RIFCSPHIGHO2_12_FULL_49_11]|nr:MAG: hypothetical protein A3F09_03265 [Chlamydiae bacterium RIFCSPHIGHO2_12_FULL_49_11]